MGIKSRFSKAGLNTGAAVDISAASNRLRRKIIRLPIGAFTASSTVKHSVGPVGVPGTVTAAYISFKTRPDIATSATVQLVAYDSSANAEVALTSAFNVEDTTTTLVAREAGAMTLAATNVALDADDTFEVHVVAGGVITTAAVDGYITVEFEPTEESSISLSER